MFISLYCVLNFNNEIIRYSINSVNSNPPTTGPFTITRYARIGFKLIGDLDLGLGRAVKAGSHNVYFMFG